MLIDELSEINPQSELNKKLKKVISSFEITQ